MALTPTLVTAAVAGIVSGLSWPVLWPLFNDPRPSASLWLVLGMLALIGVPAHVGVVGLARPEASATRSVDVALLKRTVAWLAAAGVTAALVSLY